MALQGKELLSDDKFALATIEQEDKETSILRAPRSKGGCKVGPQDIFWSKLPNPKTILYLGETRCG